MKFLLGLLLGLILLPIGAYVYFTAGSAPPAASAPPATPPATNH